MTTAPTSLQNTPIAIVTMDGPDAAILKKATKDFAADELQEANAVATQLFNALKPHLPAAGLAAPQIGISRSVFIYSYDRKPENLEVAINATYEAAGDRTVEGWEGCFSSILCNGTYKVAKLPRHYAIDATYLNERGERVEKRLEGFAAKVFQHEYDHLQGVENINRPEAEVKDFPSKEALMAFMAEVKKQDAAEYKTPS